MKGHVRDIAIRKKSTAVGIGKAYNHEVKVRLRKVTNGEVVFFLFVNPMWLDFDDSVYGTGNFLTNHVSGRLS